MIRRAHDAILLDLDGTLVGDDGRVRPRVGEALRAAHERGVVVMIATGRSELGTVDVIEDLGIRSPAVVFNGAALWCPEREVMLEERVLSNTVVERAVEAGRRRECLVVTMRTGGKFCSALRYPWEEGAMRWMEGLQVCEGWDVPTENCIRVTLLCSDQGDSETISREVEQEIARPVYMTNFALNSLAQHRTSAVQVVDVQPPCRGKGEALRILAERFDVPPERVVAVGDAGNDVPMFQGAGLAVAMANATTEAKAIADRTIGDCNTDAIADLVSEVFGV